MLFNKYEFSDRKLSWSKKEYTWDDIIGGVMILVAVGIFYVLANIY